MPLKRAKHRDPDKVRGRLLSTSLRALAQLRKELEKYEREKEDVPKAWCESYKIIADQVRRDLPDARADDAPAGVDAGDPACAPSPKTRLSGQLQVVR